KAQRTDTLVGNVFHIRRQNIFVQANHGAVCEQVVGPFFFLLGSFAETGDDVGAASFSDPGKLRIVFAFRHNLQDVLSAGQVQCFIAGNQFNNFGVAFHFGALGKGERTGKTDVKTNGFKNIYGHHGEVQAAFQFPQRHVNGVAVDGVGTFAQLQVVITQFNKTVVVTGNRNRPAGNVFVFGNIVKNNR